MIARRLIALGSLTKRSAALDTTPPTKVDVSAKPVWGPGASKSPTLTSPTPPPSLGSGVGMVPTGPSAAMRAGALSSAPNQMQAAPPPTQLPGQAAPPAQTAFPPMPAGMGTSPQLALPPNQDVMDWMNQWSG